MDKSLEIRIKKLLKEKDMTFRKLSSKVEMSENGLLKSLRNDSLRMSTVIKIADVLNVSLMDLIDIEGAEGDGIRSISMSEIIKENAELKAENQEFKLKVESLKEKLEDKRKIIDYLERENWEHRHVSIEQIKSLGDKYFENFSKKERKDVFSVGKFKDLDPLIQKKCIHAFQQERKDRMDDLGYYAIKFPNAHAKYPKDFFDED